MSPRAAWQLESIQFTQVYDYVAGKNDWLSQGLPVEVSPELELPPQAHEIMRTDVPICRHTDRLGHVADVLVEPGEHEVIVLNDAGIVLGRIRREAFEKAPELKVTEVMEVGPSTIRPGTPLGEIAQRMRDARTGRVLVTTAEGKFLGTLFLKDAEVRLEESGHRH